MQSIRELVATLVSSVANILSGITNRDTYYFSRATGDSNIDFTVENPSDTTWEIVEIRIHLEEDVGDGGNLTADIVSGVDSVYNANLITHDMTNSQDFRDNEFDCVLEADDEVNITWTNPSGRTYGLLVISRKKV